MSPVSITGELADRATDTIRFLAVDAVERAKSGHPGLPMGMADAAFTLFARTLRHDPDDPAWPDRDRFVLSAGHGSMLLYALLHLSGYDLSLDEIKRFRQWESKTPGHPEYGDTPGVETTTGPLGQGLGNAVGMALGAHRVAATFDPENQGLVGHRVFGIVSDGDLMEGVASEAASLAGHLKLGRLNLLWDDNRITIEGSTEITFTEDVGARFEAYGWHVQRVDGHDREAVAAAIDAAVADDRPSLIGCRTHIGYGSPNKQDSAAAHGAPLGEDEVQATKSARGWPSEPPFYVPEEVREFFAARRVEWTKEHKAWSKSFETWRKKNADAATAWDDWHERRVPEDLADQLFAAAPRDAGATRALAGAVLQTVSGLVPSLVGGCADLEPSTKTELKDRAWIDPGDWAGSNIRFGVREHGMGSILNGLALHGSARPFGATFLVFADYMRPSMRLAALMGLPVVYVFTHDSVYVGEDGPTHQPVEQVASLRAIPNLHVIRPADGVECAAAWAHAMARTDGPTALILTRQKLTPISRTEDFDASSILGGATVVADAEDALATIIATGSEVALALDAARLLGRDDKPVRVVSMPCVEAFDGLEADDRERLVPSAGRVAVVEAGSPQGWYRLTGRSGLVIALDRFGASAPGHEVATRLGFTPERVAERITEWLGERDTQ